MSHSSSKDNGDQRHNEWADGGDERLDPSRDRQEHCSEEEATQKEVADLLLVDALLASMSDRAAGEREHRIQIVMEAVREPCLTRQPKSYLTRWFTFAAVAASLLIAVTLFSIQSGRNALANEVLSAVNIASSTPTDRVYSVRRVLSSSGENNLPRGSLYLRGREGFVVTWGGAVLGRNDDQFWLVASGQHVTVADSFDWIDADSSRDQLGVGILQELSLRSLHVPLMQLASVAELMQYDYEVELSRVRLDGEAVDLLVGKRQSTESGLPMNIRLWADVHSHIIRRAELDWGPSNAIFLELKSGEPVPRQWYNYSAHCIGEPIVRHIPLGT